MNLGCFRSKISHYSQGVFRLLNAHLSSLEKISETRISRFQESSEKIHMYSIQKNQLIHFVWKEKNPFLFYKHAVFFTIFFIILGYYIFLCEINVLSIFYMVHFFPIFAHRKVLGIFTESHIWQGIYV